PRAVTADLLHRATHVDVDRVDRAVLLDRYARSRREDVRIVPEDLDRERPLGRGALQVGEGLITAVHEAVAADHLGVRDGGAHLAAEEPERPVGNSGERRQEVTIRQRERSEADGLDRASGGRRRRARLRAGGKRRFLAERSDRHWPGLYRRPRRAARAHDMLSGPGAILRVAAPAL